MSCPCDWNICPHSVHPNPGSTTPGVEEILWKLILCWLRNDSVRKVCWQMSHLYCGLLWDWIIRGGIWLEVEPPPLEVAEAVAAADPRLKCLWLIEMCDWRASILRKRDSWLNFLQQNMNFGFILHIPIFCQIAWFNRLRIVPNQQTSNPFLKHFSGNYQAEKHIKTTKEVSRIFWYAQSGVQAASFRKHLLEMQNFWKQCHLDECFFKVTNSDNVTNQIICAPWWCRNKYQSLKYIDTSNIHIQCFTSK